MRKIRQRNTIPEENRHHTPRTSQTSTVCCCESLTNHLFPRAVFKPLTRIKMMSHLRSVALRQAKSVVSCSAVLISTRDSSWSFMGRSKPEQTKLSRLSGCFVGGKRRGSMMHVTFGIPNMWFGLVGFEAHLFFLTLALCLLSVTLFRILVVSLRPKN